jgi:hypothetical protein
MVSEYSTLTKKQMENRFKNHDQEKVTGHDKQTIILDESVTAETDELDATFGGRTDPEDDDDLIEDDEDLLEDDDDLFPIEEDLQDDEDDEY